MTANLSRAHLLFEQGRYPMAAEEAGRQLALNPDDPLPHCLLALCLSKMERHGDAIREAQTAVHLAPDFPNGYYVLASVLDDVGRLREAEAAAREALRLDPDDADYYALLASIRVQQRQWADALQQAESGLSIDPDHTGCANLKAVALVNLGRRAEAGAAIQTNLAKDPENAATHANQGWALLHQGDHKAAMEHFREALRLKPDMEWARQGILEALRARNPIYALMLRYFLWMSRFTGKMQFGIIVGAWAGYQVVRSLESSHPALAPFLLPVVIAYLLFVYLNWTARPLFNLMLRLDKFGRYALTRDQVIASNWFGASLLVALACLAGALATGRASLWFLALAFVLLTVPLSATFGRTVENGRKWMAPATVALAALACMAGGVCFLHGPAADDLATAFFYGMGGFVWIANLSGARREYR
jgi:tetratricopeptide (TPR) repeat protein